MDEAGVKRMILLVPNDLSKPGGDAKAHSGGFAILADDEKGALIRLDADFPESVLAATGAVLFAAYSRTRDNLRAIRPATLDDRMRRFRRPAYLDRYNLSCCGEPSRYMSIYDDGSGCFFDLAISPEEARAHRSGTLFYVFICDQCCRSKKMLLPIDG